MAATSTSYPLLQESVPSTSTTTSVRYKPPITKLAIQSDKRYHVFLSFREPDVRQNLVGHLFEALSTAGLSVFPTHDEKMEMGKMDSESLEREIKSSAICIIVFSKGYADSAWCLREAAAMLKTRALIIPLYYWVEPRNVGYPLAACSPYNQSFQKHYSRSDRHPAAEVDGWRMALSEISSRFGWSLDQTQGDDGSHFAVKISDVKSLESAAFEVRQEIDILQKLNHPNIVRYLGSSVHEGRLCIFPELVTKGSLRHVLDNYKQFEENTIRMYSRQILRGLEYLHDQNIIHRDLKCANILLQPDGQVKLADFGLSKQLSQSLANSCKGTPLYMAPEMITLSKEERKYGKEVDIWSLGCTLIEMAGGKPPWSDLEGFGFLFKLKRGELPPIPDHLSEEAKNFLGMCLRVKPEERAKVSELLKHPFVINAPAVAPLFTHHSELL